jgi:hypothetical protein
VRKSGRRSRTGWRPSSGPRNRRTTGELKPGLLQSFGDAWHLEDLEGPTIDRSGFVFAITSCSRTDEGRENNGYLAGVTRLNSAGYASGRSAAGVRVQRSIRPQRLLQWRPSGQECAQATWPPDGRAGWKGTTQATPRSCPQSRLRPQARW